MSHHLPSPYICLITRDVVLSRVIQDILKFAFPLSQFQVLESFSELNVSYRGIVIYDRQTIPMPNKCGLSIVNRKDKWIAINITSSSCYDYLQLGFFGQIETNHFEFLPKAIKSIQDGELWFPRHVMESFIIDLCTNDTQKTPISITEKVTSKFSLTKKERRVFELMLQGFSNIQIARDTNVSINTVKTHAYNVMSKLDVHSRYELFAKAHELTV
ncbi:response regulator transcription factor [Vibrio coralliirubri]|uniref:helix-turn-helix transcriptional regulator n=1 Tax=Vibrio coralliirubri TaxID=1516159 RepID=UPI00063257A9|nr:response regulator transcription factor [Vibrio coralliirubri]CDU06872.1 putative response regulator [Vibrio coralliirubri]